MSRLLVIAVTVAITLAVVGVPRNADARRGLVIYNSGEDIFPAGPLPAPYDSIDQLKGAQAAFKCKIFGLFWAYFYIWGCEPVAIKGTTYYTDAKLVSAIGQKYREADMQVGLWKRHGRLLFLFVLVGLVGLGLMGRRKKTEDEPRDASDEPREASDEQTDDRR